MCPQEQLLLCSLEKLGLLSFFILFDFKFNFPFCLGLTSQPPMACLVAHNSCYQLWLPRGNPEINIADAVHEGSHWPFHCALGLPEGPAVRFHLLFVQAEAVSEPALAFHNLGTCFEEG